MNRLLLATCLLVSSITMAFPAAEIPEKDPRLDQRVTIKTVGKPLGRFLAVVSEATGVRMAARKDVADNRVCMYVKDLPLSELQEALKAVLHLQCTREGKKGEWDYEFWEDAKTRHDVQLMKQQELKELREAVEKSIKDLKLSEDELVRKFKDKDYIPYPLSDRQYRSVLEALSQADKSQMDALWQGQKVTLDATNLPDGLLGRAVEQFNAETEEGLQAMLNELNAGHPEGIQDENAADGLDAYGTRWTDIKSIVLQAVENPSTLGWCLEIAINGTEEPVKPQPADRPDEETWASGDATTRLTFETSYYDDPLEYAEHTRENASDNGTAEEESAESDPKGADDRSADEPALDIKLDRALTAYQMLVLFAEKTGRSVVSDYFTSLAVGLWGEAGDTIDMPASDLLTMLTEGVEAERTEKDGLILLANKLWYKNRECEVPEDLVERWRQIMGEQGYFGLKEVMEISRLSDAQIENMWLYGFPYAGEVTNQKPILQFISTLTNAQWKEAMHEEGLAISNLNGQQLAALRDWFDAEKTGSFVSTIEGSKTPTEKSELKAVRLTSEELQWDSGRKIQQWCAYMTMTNGDETGTVIPSLVSYGDETTPVDTDGTVEISVAGKP